MWQVRISRCFLYKRLRNLLDETFVYKNLHIIQPTFHHKSPWNNLRHYFDSRENKSYAETLIDLVKTTVFPLRSVLCKKKSILVMKIFPYTFYMTKHLKTMSILRHDKINLEVIQNVTEQFLLFTMFDYWERQIFMESITRKRTIQ